MLSQRLRVAAGLVKNGSAQGPPGTAAERPSGGLNRATRIVVRETILLSVTQSGVSHARTGSASGVGPFPVLAWWR